MELIYFTDISQLRYVLDKKPLLLEQMQPITGDIVVAYELERLNISFIDEWDFLEPADIKKNLETANNLSTSWWDENIASTEYEGFSLFDATKQDMFYPLESCLNARTVYERIFQKNHINRISGYFLPEIGVIRCGPYPTHRAVRSVTQAVLFWLADKHGIQINKLESKYPLSEGILRKRRRSLGPIKTITHDKTNEKAAKVALVLSDGLNGAEFKTLRSVFNDLPEWHFFAINQKELVLSSLINNNNNNNKSYQLQSSWVNFCKSVKKYKGPYPEIFANPYLNFQFRRIWDEMEIAINCENVFSTFLDILQPSLIIFGHEAFTIERVLVRLAKKKNISTVGLVHEGLGHIIGYNGIVGDVDSLLVWSDIGFNILKSYGINETRLNKIGCIRYELKLKKYIQESLSFGVESKNRAKKHFGVPINYPTILIVTAAINTGFYSPIANPRLHRETITELITLIKLRKDLQFIIKAHGSYDYYELYRKLNELSLSNLKFLESVTLDEVLEASDICLMINYFTTAALEAMLNRVPVIYLNTAVYNLPEWNDNLPGLILNRIQSVSELENHIDRLLADPVFKECAFVEADKLIKQIFDFKEKSATDRLLNFFKNINNGQQTISVSLPKIVHAICAQKTSNNIKDKAISNFLNEITLNHSIGNVLYAFSFIAGSNNMGISSIFKIFNVFQSHFGNENLLSWQKLWWTLLHPYISGYNYNSSKGDRYSSMCLIGLLMMHPKKFITMPALTKKEIVKYIVRTIIGSNASAVAAINKLIYLAKYMTKIYNIQ